MIPKNNVELLYLVEGAKKASGMVVVIDVFRAFSLEAYLYEMGAESIYTVGSINEALALKKMMPEAVLIGERDGKKCEGFDFGNSPCSICKSQIEGKKIIHTTSSGTKGLVSVNDADELLTGSFVNAKAIANYILQKNPKNVSLVCMGNALRLPADEDILCAEYIKGLITGDYIEDIEQQLLGLKLTAGKKFFQSELQEIYPEKDFWMCIDNSKFDFVLVAKKMEIGLVIERKFPEKTKDGMCDKWSEYKA